MRRLIALGVAIAALLAVGTVAVAQDSGTSERATQMCVVIYGETPDAGWTVDSLLTAMTSGQAVIAEIDDGSKCAGVTVGPSTAPVAGGAPFFTLSGSGTKTSAPFAAPSQWQLQYTYDCSSSLGGSGNFQVWLYNGSNPAGVPVNELGSSGASSSYVYEGGPAMHVEVISACDWSITAVP